MSDPIVDGLGCSPRNFLTRRLAADLISASDAFKEPQLFWLRTGIVSNKDFSSPDYMVLQRRGWIIASAAEVSRRRRPSALLGRIAHADRSGYGTAADFRCACRQWSRQWTDGD